MSGLCLGSPEWTKDYFKWLSNRQSHKEDRMYLMNLFCCLNRINICIPLDIRKLLFVYTQEHFHGWIVNPPYIAEPFFWSDCYDWTCDEVYAKWIAYKRYTFIS